MGGATDFVGFVGVKIAKPCQAYHPLYLSLKLEDPEDLQLEVGVARRPQLATIAYIYPVLPYIARYSCLLARTTRSRDN
jgi:hypothetical protein